jgi:hypothetical protein
LTCIYGYLMNSVALNALWPHLKDPRFRNYG